MLRLKNSMEIHEGDRISSLLHNVIYCMEKYFSTKACFQSFLCIRSTCYHEAGAIDTIALLEQNTFLVAPAEFPIFFDVEDFAGNVAEQKTATIIVTEPQCDVEVFTLLFVLTVNNTDDCVLFWY